MEPMAAEGQRSIVYTDGACLGNPGPGGWAWAVPGGRYQSGCEARSTNQRMEISAVLDAVTTLEGSIEIVSDSTYVVNCFRDRWWEGWLKRGWANSQKKPVANRDLWEPLIEAYRAQPTRVQFRWIKGHSGDTMNDLVDRLAVEAAKTQAGRSGEGTPNLLGPADDPRGSRNSRTGSGKSSGKGSGAASGAQLSGAQSSGTQSSGAQSSGAQAAPSGHLIAVTGLRPPGLGGYDVNPTSTAVRQQLAKILDAKAEIEEDVAVVTGLGLGAEQLAAEAAQDAGVDYVAVLAYPNPEKVWPKASQERFTRLRDEAREVVVLQRKEPTTRQLAGGALARRDAWLVRSSAEAIVVWDGKDSAVGRTVRSFQDGLGEEQVWILEP